MKENSDLLKTIDKMRREHDDIIDKENNNKSAFDSLLQE